MWTDFANKDELDKFPKGAVPQEIVVTTGDKIKYCHMLELLVLAEIPTLFVGPTGTGKTKYVQTVLNDKLPQDRWKIVEVGFSARTHCNQVQEIVDNKLGKIRKGIFGPGFGKKAAIFVDDLNMPKVEKYGAQPPVEILRQCIDQGGWYDLKDNTHPFKRIVDTNVVAAMGPPGGGRAVITPRFQRHFNVIAFVNLDEAQLETIFRSILKWHFREGKYASEVANLEHKVVKATNKVFERIQEELKPTPLKTHYTFNLRDFSAVICGLTMAGKDSLTSANQLIRLWAHETCRVFGDRLINNDDRMWMLDCVKQCFQNPFSAQFDSVLAHLDLDGNNKVETLDEFRGLLWGDIYTQFGMPDRPYVELMDK